MILAPSARACKAKCSTVLNCLGVGPYRLEPDRKGPTMNQKVRFIRSARGLSKSSGAAPEQTTTTIDELVGTLTRSVYDMSSVATHVAKERKAVVRIKLYVVAILHEMLES